MQPFSVNEDQVANDDFLAKEEWIALRLNERKKVEFQNTDQQAFWIAQLNDAPTLAERALNILTSFSTTYLCEKGFATVFPLNAKKERICEIMSGGFAVKIQQCIKKVRRFLVTFSFC